MKINIEKSNYSHIEILELAVWRLSKYTGTEQWNYIFNISNNHKEPEVEFRSYDKINLFLSRKDRSCPFLSSMPNFYREEVPL